nr:GtrA family protein [Comamonas granuli]
MHPVDYRHRSVLLVRRQAGHVAWFIVVGSCAAAVHWTVATASVAYAGLPPLRANVMGWLVALAVSFAGHHLLSFRGHGNRLGQAAARFFLISAGGFAVNETAYALLLRWSGLRYDLLLALVLAGVAGLTYVLSRHWAFLRNPQH